MIVSLDSFVAFLQIYVIKMPPCVKGDNGPVGIMLSAVVRPLLMYLHIQVVCLASVIISSIYFCDIGSNIRIAIAGAALLLGMIGVVGRIWVTTGWLHVLFGLAMLVMTVLDVIAMFENTQTNEIGASVCTVVSSSSCCRNAQR